MGALFPGVAVVMFKELFWFCFCRGSWFTRVLGCVYVGVFVLLVDLCSCYFICNIDLNCDCCMHLLLLLSGCIVWYGFGVLLV